MKALTLLLSFSLAVSKCTVAASGSEGRRNRRQSSRYDAPPPPIQEPQQQQGLGRPLNTFGYVDLPLGDDGAMQAFGQAAPMDPGMYGGGGGGSYTPAYPLPPPASYHLPPTLPSEYPVETYPSAAMPAYDANPYGQEPQPFQGDYTSEAHSQSFAGEGIVPQQHHHSRKGRKADSEKRKKPLTFRPVIWESSPWQGQEQQRNEEERVYELPPEVEANHKDFKKKRQTKEGSEKREKVRQQFWPQEALDDMARQTAAMHISGLAPIQTSHGGREGLSMQSSYDMPSGSMTAGGKRDKGKGVVSRSQQEPQTARLPSATERRRGDENEISDGELEGFVKRPRTYDESETDAQVRRYTRELIKAEWDTRQLSFTRFSPEEMAAQFTEIKIRNSGYARPISAQATSMVRMATSVTQPTYLTEFQAATKTYWRRIEYMRGRYVPPSSSNGDEEIPVKMLLQQFRKSLEKDKRKALEAQYFQSTLQAAQQDGAQEDHYDVPVEQAEDMDATIAQAIWDDFEAQMLLPAIREGYPYCMSLVGSLIPLYVHRQYPPHQTQYLLFKHLRDVQRVTDAELQEVFRSASSSSAPPPPPPQQ